MKLDWVVTSVMGTAGVVALTVCLGAQHQLRLRLMEERKALQQQLTQMGQLIASNEQLSNVLGQADSPQAVRDDESRELMRLRGQVVALRQQVADLQTVRAENRNARAALESSVKTQSTAGPATADYWPQDSWTFKGYASPDAALQSSLWAANNGDLKGVLASATGDIQKHMEEDFTDKSETEASIKAMDEVMNIKSVRILNREEQGADTVVLTAEFEGKTETHTGKLVMKKVGNDWKIAELGN